MKTLLRLSMLLLLWLTAARPDAQAQAEGTAFSCDGTFYQIRQVGSTSSLFRVNRSNTAYTTEPVNIVPAANNTRTNNLGVLLNGLAYNSQDGYLYALSTNGNTNTLPGSIQMYKIGQGGIQLLGTVTGILPAIQVASGTIDKNGNYYVSSQNTAGTANYNLYRFDLTANTPAGKLAATALRLYNAKDAKQTNLTFYDLAVNPQDNLLYAVFQNGTLWRVDPAAVAGQALVTPIKATATNNSPVGTAFFDVAGNLFAYTNGTVGTANSAIFYSVDLTTGAYTQISTVDPASVSDGASCINPDQRIDVVKQVNSISRVGTTDQVFDIAFTLRVKNTSTTTDNNVQINDFLWSGSGTTVRANTTFSATAGKLPSSVTIQVPTVVTADPTNVNSVFELVRNPSFNGVGGPAPAVTAALLTGTQPLTAGQAAIITFTVRVTYPNATSVPARLTNEAYASSTVEANPTGYRQNATSGFISSPDQLQATDRSTDGPSLPLAANSDTPTPSPIFFSRSISGTVFEDINYGGGAGRSQTLSRGLGAANVRVELYNSAGDFLTFTNTDAAGNYAFSTTDGGTTELAAGTVYQVRTVNSSVLSNRPGSVAGLRAVQTFNNGDVNAVGGANPNNADAPANAGTTTGTGGQSLTALVTANAGSVVQTIASVSTPGTTAANAATTGVDFGFNFSTVVNTNNSGQGSLRQFILNSNALTNFGLDQDTFNGTTATGTTVIDPILGTEYAIFMLNDGRTTGTTLPGLRLGMTAPANYDNASKAFTFKLAALPTITDKNTAIDGKLQTILTGEGTTPTTANLAGEVILDFNTSNRGGLSITGGNTRIASLNITGAGNIGGGANGSRALNTTGATIADGVAIVFTGDATAGSIVTDVTGLNNTVATVLLANGATNITLSNNSFRSGRSVDAATGTIAYDGAGVLLSNASDNTIKNNNISNNSGFGIELMAGSNRNLISGNIVSTNGLASSTTADDAGISITLGNDNVISNNTISNNIGDGIVVLTGTSGNRFSQNSISGNGDLGIDLSVSNDAQGDGITPNANGKTAASGANGLLNFPVIFRTSSSGGNLEVTGYAPAGSTLEFFISDKTAPAFGQGRTYLFTRTEGSAADLTARTGSYSGMVNGLNQGSETGAQIFVFSIPISSLTALTAAQRTSLTDGTAYITSTATLNNATSEFSGNAKVILAAPLPVTLVSFGAQAAGQNAQLNWKTAQELNNDHFVIERSFDGRGFVSVGQVKGQGSTQSANTYDFTDERVAALAPAGLVYYRLRQVDTDGTAALSEVQTVRFPLTARALFDMYPNPATAIQDAKLDLSGAPAGSYQVTLVDMTGRTLRSFAQNGGTVQELQLANLPAGTYLVRVQGNGQSFSRRVIKE